MNELQLLWAALIHVFNVPPIASDASLDKIAREFFSQRKEIKKAGLENQLNNFFANAYPDYLVVLLPPVRTGSSVGGEEEEIRNLVTQLQDIAIQHEMIEQTVPVMIASSSTEHVRPIIKPASAILSTAPASFPYAWMEKIRQVREQRMARLTREQRDAIFFATSNEVGPENQRRIDLLKTSLQQPTIPQSKATPVISGGSVSQLRAGLQGRLPFFTPQAPKMSASPLSRTISIPSTEPTRIEQVTQAPRLSKEDFGSLLIQAALDANGDYTDDKSQDFVVTLATGDVKDAVAAIAFFLNDPATSFEARTFGASFIGKINEVFLRNNLPEHVVTARSDGKYLKTDIEIKMLPVFNDNIQSVSVDTPYASPSMY